MKLTKQKSLCAVLCLGTSLAWMALSGAARAEGFTTTTVQGTVYLANGHPGSGSLQVSWPAFTTANNQAVAAGRINVTIGTDGYVSLNLAANLGATPAGLYYTAVFHLSDGTTSTEYWVVPSAAQASLSQVRAQVMPAAQAVQAVSKAYVDQSVQELTQSLLTASGGSLSGPLFLNGDPLQPTQAASKHYVDTEFGMAVPMSGGALTGPLTSVQLGAAYQVDQFPGGDFGAKLQACLNTLNATYGGTCDARNFSGNLVLSSSLIIGKANATVQLPCATISTSNKIQVLAGTRNVTLHGCALRGASASSGSAGGTVFLYSGTGAMMEVGDPTYGVDTSGFHIDNAVINTTGSNSSTAEGLAAYRTQEMNLASLYLLGNPSQTGMTLDGTGNYTGGTFQDIELGGFGTAVNAIGHQNANAMTTDWLNASTFLRLHIDCPTNGSAPIAGTYGINLQQGDGNTFTGGDVEGCSTALHLGPNAQNNTIVGLRNENSTNQVVADAGSSYNNWITGGTMFTGQLTDNGTRNSFLDTFHRSFNGLNGDWYGSQQDATVTNHFRLGTGSGNERGLLNRYQTDSGYRWTTGFSDASAGEQFYQVLDELNNVYRLSIGQYNNGQSSSNNQTVINAAGSGAVVLNGSSNSGTGGIVFGSGGANAALVGSINNAGNAQFNGTLQVGGPSTFTNSTTVKNQADAEIDSFLWAGATANQKESYTYKDYTGASQWYMVKDASNNWALNSATGGLDSFKAYQSSNSGDTYINASNPTGHIRLNYETGSGAETDIYSGASSGLVAAFLGSTAIKFPGLAAASGHNCLQIDNSGYISNSGSVCGSSQNGIVNTGNAGQVAYYTGNGNVIAGMNAVAVNAGGTGASSSAQALQNLGAQPVLTGVASDGTLGIAVAGNVAANASIPAMQPVADVTHPSYGARGDGVHDDAPAFRAAKNALVSAGGGTLYIPKGTYFLSTPDADNGSFVNIVGSHVHVVCAPGAILNSTNNTYTMFRLGQIAGYGLQSYTLTGIGSPLNYSYQANVIPTIGSGTITLTTPSDTSHFAVGDPIYILGGPGAESNGDGEINWVTAIDSGTGILTLRKPTSKPYTGNISNVGTPGIVTVMDGAGKFYEDLSIEGCTANPGSDFAYVGQAIGVKILNNHVVVKPTATRGMMVNSYYPMADIEIAGNSYTQSAGTVGIQLADGWRDIYIHDNDWTSEYGNVILNISQGTVNTTVNHNSFYYTIPSTWGGNAAAIEFATAYQVQVTNNFFSVANLTAGNSASAIATGLSNGVCVNCIVSDNNIVYSSTNDVGQAISVYGSPISLLGNRINVVGARGGISVSSATGKNVKPDIIGNDITLTGTAINAFGISVGSATSVDQAQVIVQGNVVRGETGAFGTAIYFTAAGGGNLSNNYVSNLPAAINLTIGANTGAPTMMNNTCVSVTTTTNCGSPGVPLTNQSNAFTSGTQDFHAADHTLPAKSGTTAAMPGTCSVGEEYFATNVTAGQNKFLCTAANTWTQGAGGGGSSSPAPFGGLVEDSHPVGTTPAMGWMGGCSGQGGSSFIGAGVSNPLMVQATSGTTSGQCAGYYGTTSNYYSGRQPLVKVGVGYSVAGDYGANRIWLGLFFIGCTQATMIASDTPACTYAAIRYSTSAGDSVYQCVSDTGSGTPQVQAIGSVAPTTAFTVMSISITDAGATCNVAGTSVTNATKFPGNAVYMAGLWANTTLANAATHLRLSEVYGVHLNGTW